MVSKERIKYLEKKLLGIIKSITEVQQLTDWKFKQQDTLSAEAVDFDDSLWEIVNPGLSFWAYKAESWFRKDIILPEEIDGISITGSKIEFRFQIVGGSELYLNGKYLDRQDFWSDFYIVLTPSAKAKERFTIAIKNHKSDTVAYFCTSYLTIYPLDTIGL